MEEQVHVVLDGGDDISRTGLQRDAHLGICPEVGHAHVVDGLLVVLRDLLLTRLAMSP